MAEITQTFDVSAPTPIVWAALQDVPALVPCMPGAALLQVDGDTYIGRLRVKVGPIAAEFEGTARVVERDEARHRARIEASGVDRRGGNRGSASVEYQLSPVDAGTRVALLADYRLRGPMAQFGRTGLIADMSAKLTREFAECLRHRLGEGTASEPPRSEEEP